jgi:hypothetical protein
MVRSRFRQLVSLLHSGTVRPQRKSVGSVQVNLDRKCEVHTTSTVFYYSVVGVVLTCLPPGGNFSILLMPLQIDSLELNQEAWLDFL